MEDINELRRIGDQLQSSSSRVFAKIRSMYRDSPDDIVYALGYEAYMALLEGERAIEEWTNERKKAGR